MNTATAPNPAIAAFNVAVSRARGALPSVQFSNDIITNQVKPKMLATILDETIPAHEPILITGSPGIGKSDIVSQACARTKAQSIIVHPVVCDPTDFKGMPWVTSDGAEFKEFGELKLLMTAKRLTVCFIDDLGQALPSVQAAVMQMLLARQVNGKKISPHVVFIAATNRRQDRAASNGIIEPLKSRFLTIVELLADYRQWVKWARESNAIVPEVIAYLGFRTEMFNKFEPSQDLVNSPSPRTWAAMSRIFKLNLSDEAKLPMYTGAVGQAAALEFTGYVKLLRHMVSTQAVFATQGRAPIPDKPDALHALLTALAMQVTEPLMGAFCTYMQAVHAAGRGEFVVQAVNQAIARNVLLANCTPYIDMETGPVGDALKGEVIS